MNVEYRQTKAFDETGREKAHVTCKADQINFVFPQGSDYLSLMLLARAPLSFNRKCNKPSLRRTQKSGSVRVVAYDNCDFCAGDTTLSNRIRQRQHVRAATRD